MPATVKRSAGNKTANFTMRIEPQKKTLLEALYRKLGISLPDAVNMFFEKSLNVGGVPFELKVEDYDRETFVAMKEAIDIESGLIKAKRYKTADELFADNDAR